MANLNRKNKFTYFFSSLCLEQKHITKLILNFFFFYTTKIKQYDKKI